MVFNGGKTRIEGNIDFTDFYVLLQNHQDRKQQKSIMDESMFDIIVENLFRVLMNDLFEEGKQTSLIQKDEQPKLIVPCKASE